MSVSVNGNDLAEMLPLFFIILVVIAAAAGILLFAVKRQDDRKPLVKENVKVLEKLSQQGNIAWYIVENERGQRLKLRSFHADTTILAVGDKGLLAYKGQTIQSFNRSRS